MTVAESEKEKEARETIERENIIKELEELKSNSNSNKQLILVVTSEKGTILHFHKFTTMEEVAWALMTAQTMAVNIIREHYATGS